MAESGEQSGPALLVGITLACLLELGRRGTGRPLTAQLVEFSQPMGDVQAKLILAVASGWAQTVTD